MLHFKDFFFLLIKNSQRGEERRKAEESEPKYVEMTVTHPTFRQCWLAVFVPEQKYRHKDQTKEMKGLYNTLILVHEDGSNNKNIDHVLAES